LGLFVFTEVIMRAKWSLRLVTIRDDPRKRTLLSAADQTGAFLDGAIALNRKQHLVMRYAVGPDTKKKPHTLSHVRL
jgi:hypothetical protein